MNDDVSKITFEQRLSQSSTDQTVSRSDVSLLSKKDISCLFQISERQVTNLMKTPRFPKKIKGLGRSVRFSASAVKEFVQNG